MKIRQFKQFKRWQVKGWPAIFLGLATVVAIALTQCTPQSTIPSSPEVSGSAASSTLVFGAVSDAVSLESGNITDGYSIAVQMQIYDRLLDTEPGKTDLIPGLATAWSASADGLTWTFKLRDGIQFHDGTALDAEAVRANIDRWWNPDSPLGFRNAGKTYEIWSSLFGGFKGSPESLLQAVRVVDNLTLQFVLSQPFAAFPAAIGSSYFGIASPTAIQKAGGDYGTPSSTAVGTGAFVLKEWRIGDRIVLDKNPNYWNGPAQVDQVVFRTLKEASGRLAELRAGTIDFTENLSPEQRSEIKADPNLKELLRPSFNTGYLTLNPSYEPLANKAVRQAIAMTINRKALVEAFWAGLGTSDGHFTPPAMQQFQDASLGDYEYNPDKAKKLLAEAGYPNGFDLELWYMPINGTSFPTPKPIAEAWAADLTRIGIRTRLNTKDWAAYLADRLKPPGFQAFMMGWTGDYGDPDNFFYYHFSPSGTKDLGNWQNDRLFKLLDEARQKSQVSDRAKLYAEVDKLVFEEAVRIPIVHSQPLLAHRANISGWQPSPLGAESFVRIEKN
ncbi:MAG: ABC transporter substrate-binding protein [Leptolyngbyaceae cyanobacterium CRU_2_3]|nr:ABC transporter substrate-binding protein [Leptolyngbyaceae cyanobacterium CRU_2_3]